MVTFNPRSFNNLANDAAIIPFPIDETTPPDTNTYFVISKTSFDLGGKNKKIPIPKLEQGELSFYVLLRNHLVCSEPINYFTRI